MPHVELRDIHSTLGGISILRGMDFRIPDVASTVAGDPYIVLLGPSGCGKSTTLRTIAGLQSPDQGQVLIGGEDVTTRPSRRRDVAMVFQGDSLYPHLTIRQSLAVSAARTTDRSKRESQIGRAILMTGISAIADRHPDRLSGGELRRAAIAKVIASGASVRLLDEPLSALDASVRHGLAADLRRFHDTDAATTIHVTHDGDEAMRMADLIAVMAGGRIVQFDTPSQIYDAPNSVTVAQSIGTPPMNFLNASIANGEVCFEDDRIRLRRCESVDHIVGISSASSVKNIIVGVRPASVHLGELGSTSLVLSIVRSSLSICRMNHSLLITVPIEGQAFAALLPRTTLFETTSLEKDTVSIAAGFDDLHFFDRATGIRINDRSDR
ncbi:Trehalose import ATP-binding protein SugC [Rubripirellula tenax]|uniref:Trehalose import ATP-binding protein SugC n=1 Tax=Rubripirellula tenax TaxID=2528015 RepID=A0A5C6F1Y6_9BACT|nr:ABC transporter ATP-binding protein [Rubripirellula tenax]TWU54604.1 Trehalose import ATP-binding protein SugC [Rubripirellula tenax]